MSNQRYHLPVLYLSIFLLALNGLFAKLIPLDAVSIIQLRGIISAIGLSLFIFQQKRTFKLTGIRTVVGVYSLGVLLGLHWVTFFHAMQISTVAIGMLSLFTYPVITIVLEPLFTKQPIKNQDIFCGIFMLIGLAVMVGPDPTKWQNSFTLGIFWGVLSALLFALRNLFQKYHFNHVTSDGLMFHQVIAVAVMLAMFVDYPQVQMLDSLDLFKLILLGLFSTATAHTLLSYSLKQLPAKSVALISCLQPVIAAILAWYIIGETPQPQVIIGGGMILSIAIYETLQKQSLK